MTGHDETFKRLSLCALWCLGEAIEVWSNHPFASNEEEAEAARKFMGPYVVMLRLRAAIICRVQKPVPGSLSLMSPDVGATSNAEALAAMVEAFGVTRLPYRAQLRAAALRLLAHEAQTAAWFDTMRELKELGEVE